MVNTTIEQKAHQASSAKAAWEEYQSELAAIERKTERLRKLRLEKEVREAATTKPKTKKRRQMTDEPELRCSECNKRVLLVGIEMQSDGIEDVLTFECESGHFMTVTLPRNSLP